MPLRVRDGAADASAAGEKTAHAFRSIGEVAEILDVPQHVLRFWEGKFVQIKPLKHRGGRRYYRASDIALLCGVHKLLYADRYTIEGVQKLFAQRGAGFIAGIGRDAMSESGGGVAEELGEAEVEGEASGSAASAALGVGARERLLRALDKLEEIGAALQSAGESEPADGGT